MTEQAGTSKNSAHGIERFIEELATLIGRIFGAALKVSWFGMRKNYPRSVSSVLAWLVGVEAIWLLTRDHLYLELIHSYFPNALSERALLFWMKAPQLLHFVCWSFIIVNGVYFALGLVAFGVNQYYQNKLDVMGFKNAKDVKAEIADIVKIGKFRVKLLINSCGVGLERYVSRQSDLEAAFHMAVDSVKMTNDRRFIEMILTKYQLPKFTHFNEMRDQLTTPYSFIIGKSQAGVITQSIRTLPHLLVAGSSGGGKSFFFRQLLLGLMRSPRVQLYLLDLKMGVEVKEFQTLPNVKVAKNEAESVHLLEAICREMRLRFKYLEKEGFKFIEPERDKRDLIVCAVDEASVLFSKGSSSGSKKNLILKARDLTDEIAKLGRAASIHLILATQKVTKETVDTRVQENIGGRLCLKMNTLQGSMTVLGNKKAYELPDIKGRGIWVNGNDFIEVQTPFISAEEVNEEVEVLKEKFKDESFRPFQPLLAAVGTDKNTPKDDAYSGVIESRAEEIIEDNEA